MLKTSVERRLRAIVVLHQNHAQLDARRADANDVTRLQDSRAVDAMTVQEGTVTAAVRNDALTVRGCNFAMSTRNAGHVLLQVGDGLRIGSPGFEFQLISAENAHG